MISPTNTKRIKLKNNYYDHQKLRLTKVSISNSAFRNQGKSGLIKAARIFIYKNIDLNEFSVSLKNKTYKRFLDSSTNKLLKSLSAYDCRWGTARKGLNIFFRDVLYNSYFYKELKLNFRYGSQLEIPLDSKTMTSLLKNYKYSNSEKYLEKPILTSIVQLDKNNSEKFQLLAEEIAKNRYAGYSRVDLDMEYWASD